ncbi:hypothetical protein HK096_005516, partial [Nowakowskiella sp. JEL0078]
MSEIENRFLGRTGLKVSVIALGTAPFGTRVNEKDAEDAIKAAFEAGVNFFDTAEVYSETKSEVILGNALKKFGWKRSQY